MPHKVAKTIRKFKAGKLRSGSGEIVSGYDQAVAIGLSVGHTAEFTERRIAAQRRRGRRKRKA